MPVPPDPVLRAAVRWLERLPVSGAARLRALFAAHADFSDITPTQYEAAYAWIQSAGLLDDLYSEIPASRRVFDSAIANSRASWLPDADQLVRSVDELPEDVLRAAAALGLGESEAFGHLGAVWGKVDTQERARIGTAGELALVELLEAAENTRVEHVAAWSDGFGYDITVHGPSRSTHLEVKSTVRRSRLAVYLSRNEYETMRHDPEWELVVIGLTPSLEMRAVATVPREWIAAQVPTDSSILGRWESCRLDVPAEVPVPGIPRITEEIADEVPTLLSGAAGWPG